MILELSGENARQCWSGWMLFEPCAVMLVQVHLVPLRLPRKVGIAPRKTWPLLSGGAATYQSYQAWPVQGFALATAGKGVIFFQVVPLRRHSSGVVPLAPNT